MSKYIIVLSAFVSLFAQSCKEGSFSQVVTIDLPEHEPKPAVKLQLEANNLSPFSALISNSKGILDPESDYKVPTDAIVQLFKNDELWSQLQYDAQSVHYLGAENEIISHNLGDVYRLEVDLEGYEKVSATQTMPAKPIITDATYEVEGTIDAEGFRVDEIIVNIEDAAPNETNYYALRAFNIDYQIDFNGDTINSNRYMFYLDTNDPLLSYGVDYSLIFTDDAFANQTFQVRAYTYNGANENVTIEVELLQLTKDAFLHERSLEQYRNAIDNPFAEPVTVHNNIEGGFGIFSLANSTIFKIK